jgi:CubicO group peptidase (beta-lactamase class C family)
VFVLAGLFVMSTAGWAQQTTVVVPESAGFSSVKLANIDKIVEEAINNKAVPGAVVLVARHGKIAYSKAYGIADFGVPLKTDAIFRIASMTKAVTTVAVLQLFDQGKLSLNDPISKYIPEFKDPQVAELDPRGKFKYVPANREILIHDLLSMSSGIYSRAGGDDFLNKLADLYGEMGLEDEMGPLNMTLEQYAKIVAKLPLGAHPGTTFHYSNAGANVLGHLVEIVSGQRFDRYLEENIFKPLKMSETMFFPARDQLPRVPPPFLTGTDTKMTTPQPWGRRTVSHTYTTDPNKKFFNPSGGLHSTAEDFFRFSQMLLNKGELDGVRVLSAEAVEIMSTPVIKMTFLGNMWGYMVQIQDAVNPFGQVSLDYLGAEGAWGWIGYWGTKFIVNPKKDMIFIFMSSINVFPGILPYQQRVVQAVNGAMIY